jgi:hypothetical protein
MLLIADGLRKDLEAAFEQVREDLLEARCHHRVKDTPDHRSAVQECLVQIDRILDMYLEMRHTCR